MFGILLGIYLLLAVLGGIAAQKWKRRTGLWWGLAFLLLLIPIYSFWILGIPEVRGSTGPMRQVLLRWVDIVEKTDGVSRADALDTTASVVRMLLSDICLLIAVAVSLVIVPALPMRDTRARLACPHCAEMILPAAKICPHCRQQLEEGWTAPKMRPVELPPQLQGESEADYQARMGRLGYRVLSAESGHA